MGHNFAGKFHIHFHLQLLTLCYLPSSKPMFYLCFNFQLVFDPTVLKTAKQIIYEESGEDGFVCFLNEPSARWNRYFSSKKKHFILILSGAVVTNTWNTSCQPFSRLFMVGWRRSTGVSFTSCQLLFYRSHF